MAIQLTIPTADGGALSYHVIRSVVVDFLAPSADVVVNHYMAKSDFLANNNPMSWDLYNINALYANLRQPPNIDQIEDYLIANPPAGTTFAAAAANSAPIKVD